MISRIERKIGIRAVLALAVMAGCSHSTATNNGPASGSGLPTVGSIFTYVDSALNPLTGQFVVINESDTVLESGVTLPGLMNAVLLSPNTRTFLYYTRVTVDSSGTIAVDQTEVDADGPPMFAMTSTGDLAIPGISTTTIFTDSLGRVVSDDSTVVSYIYPIHTQTNFIQTSEQWPSPTDSIAWAQPATFTIQNTSLTCEHAVRLHHNFVGTGQDVNPVKTDLYFSTTLGMPVTMVVNQAGVNGTFQPVASKHLVAYELK